VEGWWQDAWTTKKTIVQGGDWVAMTHRVSSVGSGTQKKRGSGVHGCATWAM